MNKDEQKPGADERTTLSIIQDIKNNVLDPKTLSPDERYRCVDFLLREGYTQEQAAQVFKTTDRTIRRDIVKFNKENKLTASGDLSKEIIGDMYRKATMHHAYLVRCARSPELSVVERGQLEFMAWRVLKETIEKMQSLGYLPFRPQEITGDLFHHFDDQNVEKSYEDARKTLNEVVDVAKQCGNWTPELEKNINLLQKKIEKAEVIQESEKLLKEQANENKEDKKDDKQD
jgi:hypothetical protein